MNGGLSQNARTFRSTFPEFFETAYGQDQLELQLGDWLLSQPDDKSGGDV